jgi:hypothetical protein
MSEPIIFNYESQAPVQAHGQNKGQSIIKPHSHLQFKPQFPHYTPNRRSPMSYLPSLPTPLTSSLSPFMRKASIRSTSLPDRSAASSLPLYSRSLGAGSPCPGTISFPLVTPRMSGYINLGAGFSPLSGTCFLFMLFTFMFLLVSPDAFASLSTPFTTKLTTLSSQLELIGKSIVGVSVLVGIILSATGNPQWKMIITAICVGVAIIGFNVIKQFIGL